MENEITPQQAIESLEKLNTFLGQQTEKFAVRGVCDLSSGEKEQIGQQILQAHRRHFGQNNTYEQSVGAEMPQYNEGRKLAPTGNTSPRPPDKSLDYLIFISILLLQEKFGIVKKETFDEVLLSYDPTLNLKPIGPKLSNWKKEGLLYWPGRNTALREVTGKGKQHMRLIFQEARQNAERIEKAIRHVIDDTYEFAAIDS